MMEGSSWIRPVRNPVARILLSSTLPDDALAVLLNVVGHEETKIKTFLSNISDYLWDYVVNRGPYRTEEMAILDFDTELRDILKALGPRVDLTHFEPARLTDSSYHDNLLGACASEGVILEHRIVEGVHVDLIGRATTVLRRVLRLKFENIYMDVSEEPESFHILYLEARAGSYATRKLQTLSKLVKLLLRTVPAVSGTVAQSNVGITRMEGNSGSWRFVTEPSPFNYPISRLEKLFLMAGAASAKVLEDETKPRVVFLCEDKAEKLVLESKKLYPERTNPYFFASKYGIYSENFLKRLKHGL
jgi:hypothetical protein